MEVGVLIEIARVLFRKKPVRFRPAPVLNSGQGFIVILDEFSPRG